MQVRGDPGDAEEDVQRCISDTEAGAELSPALCVIVVGQADSGLHDCMEAHQGLSIETRDSRPSARNPRTPTGGLQSYQEQHPDDVVVALPVDPHSVSTREINLTTYEEHQCYGHQYVHPKEIHRAFRSPACGG
jgi:hypothetical protein